MLKEAHISKIEQKYAIPPTKARELAEAGILASVDAEEVSRLLGRDGVEGGGILIRYPSTEMFAVRLDIPRPRRDRPGKVQKYDRPSGLSPRLFVPPGLDIEAVAEIWVTEGELKALAGWAYGLPVAALAGVWNWRQDVDETDPELAAAKLAGQGGKAPDPEAMIEDLRRDWTGKTIVLIYDSDICQDHPAWPAFGRLAEQLYARGAAAVKVITLPTIPPLEGEGQDGAEKTGLDDYLRRRKALGFDAAAELRELVRRAPIWVPSAGEVLGCPDKTATLKGLEQFARPRLASDDMTQKVLGAAAYYLARRETLLQAAIRDTGIKGEMTQAVKKDARAEAERIRERQALRRAVEKEAGAKAGRLIIEAFPPAEEVLPADFPFPETGRKYERFDIRGGQVVRVRVRIDEDGEKREDLYPLTDTVILLSQRVVPVEQDTGVEKWGIAWWERNRWRYADIASRYLFDRKKVGELLDAGVPVSSSNVDGLVEWLQHLRCLATLGRQGAPELPTIHSVSRCGWHELGDKFFVFGREILLPGGEASRADAGDREEIQVDAGGQTEADIRWAEDISAMERQILASFRCGGDPEAHRRLLIETAMNYPQVAFGLGAAAGAPLLRFVRKAGFIDIDGYCVFMVPRAGGRSRHQGKSTWNAVIASLYGWPGTGAEGRLRFADRTRAALGVLLATCCDMTVHLEELQHLARAAKKEAAQELAHLIYQVAHGQDRERAARAGGGRRTRSFHVVLFGTAETDVTTSLPVGSGAHDRVLKLPPLLPEETDANRDEAERLLQLAAANHGHAGRRYLAWLTRRLAEEGEGFILDDVSIALEELRRNLPADSRRASAGRIASRAAVAMAGLSLLLEALGASQEEADACLESFLHGWEMVVEGIPAETVAERALEAAQSYIAQNAESITGLRQDKERPPARWVGARAKVSDDAGNRIEVVALIESAFAEAMSREPFDLDPAHALQALATAGYIVTRTEKKEDGRTTVRSKLPVRVGETLARCVCIRWDLISLTKGDGENQDQDLELEDTPY